MTVRRFLLLAWLDFLARFRIGNARRRLGQLRRRRTTDATNPQMTTAQRAASDEGRTETNRSEVVNEH